ncbi:MAG: hypothetical protein DRN53_08230 [Thermoprotei archaeon]|nr:MAG: hypothetical protein DRN53_08230 [Thermoprotei archaeon]
MQSTAWIDVLTPKQALIAVCLYEEFQKTGVDVIITCRKYDYTISILKKRLEPVVLGEFGGRSRISKLIASSKRQLELSKYWLSKRNPNLHISMTSPEGTRVAFGLGIPILLLSDSPHSTFVNRLTIPLADIVIVPQALSPTNYSYTITKVNKFIRFNGVFELMWIKNFIPKENVLKNLGVNKYEYIVLRPGEFKAAYYPAMNIKQSIMLDIVTELVKRIDVVILPRYHDQYELLKRELGSDVIVPRTAVDTLSLEYYALAVITGGLTMATEASLMGTPAITVFPKRLKIEQFLKRMGFPIYHIEVNELREFILKILEAPWNYRKDTKELLSKLESPTPIIIEKSLELIELSQSKGF